MKKTQAAISILAILAALAGCEAGAPGGAPTGGSPANAQSTNKSAAAKARNHRLEDALLPRQGSDEYYLGAQKQLANFQDAGLLPVKTKLRFDYVSYYKPLRDVHYDNGKLLYFEHEFMEAYLGCCVNEGFGLIVEGSADDKLRQFATGHGCAVKDSGQFYIDPSLEKLLPKAPVYELSCRAQDAEPQEDRE